MIKPLDFNTFKRLKKMSFNDMNRWLKSFYETAHQNGVDEAVENGVVVPEPPEHCTVAIANDDLYDLLLSIKGIGETRANEIMDKMEEFGVDPSVWKMEDNE